MTTYHQVTMILKKYLLGVDKEWYQRYQVFIAHLVGKEGFKPQLVVSNTNTNIVQLLKNPDINHLLNVFVSNPNMNSQILDSLSDVNWDLTQLSSKSHISIDFIKRNMRTRKFNWVTISANQFITMEDIKYYTNIPWDFRGVSQNPNLNIYYVNLYFQQGRNLDWNAISQHPKITMEDIQTHPHLKWQGKYVALNPNITTHFITSQVNWVWDYGQLSKNPSLRLRYVFQNLQLDWCWTSLSSHPRLTPGIIAKYPDLPWSWFHISANPNFKVSAFRKHKHLKLDWHGLSCNPNLTLNYIIQNIDLKWNIGYLCYNTFQSEKSKFYEYHLRRYFMAQKIARYWKKQVSNLNCQIGRKISTLRYDKLTDKHDQMYIDEAQAHRLFAENNYC